jgi:hypothetical protein
VFPDGGAHLPGTVAITFNTSEPYYSLDNTLSDVPARGFFDQGTPNQSVPPYSVDLVMTVTAGRQSSHYEAVLQRRWPYVITGPQVTMMGAPADPPPPGGCSPTRITGAIFEPALVFPTPCPVRPPPSPTPLMVTTNMMGAIKSANTMHVPTVQVGGNYGQTDASFPFLSVKNVLSGRVDFQGPNTGNDSVAVAPCNTWNGLPRYNVGSQQDVDRLSNIFTLPDVSKLKWDSITPGSNIGAQSGAFFLMTANVWLGDQPASEPATVFPGAYGHAFYVAGGMGNERVQQQANPCCASTGTQMSRFNYNLVLNDCILFVDGDLDLGSGIKDGIGSLTGSNATLIVNGSLILAGGKLSAQNQGMVIYCNNLLTATSGSYNGLIVVRDSAIVVPPPAWASNGSGQTAFNIDGAMVVGGTPFYVQEANPPPCCGANLPLDTPGLGLWSASIKYDPRYLKSLHQFGSYNLLALRHLP